MHNIGNCSLVFNVAIKRRHQLTWDDELTLDARDSILDVLFPCGMQFFQWNSEFLVVILLPADILPPSKQYKISAFLK